MRKVTSFFIFSAITLFFSCTKNNKEDILAGQGPCNTTVTTYGEVVKPILDQFCNTSGCHNNVSLAAGLNLEDYNSLKPIALGDRFLGSLKHQSGFSPMPKGGDKLTDCQIEKIEKWVINGAQNN
jgi:hypothetical protein